MSIYIRYAYFPSNLFLIEILRSVENIRYLSIIECNLSTFKPVVDKSNDHLKTIDLSKNVISKMHKQSPGHFEISISFSIDENKLVKIFCNAFSFSKRFAVLNLSRNLLTYFKQCMLSGVDSILHMDISDNLIHTLEHTAFSHVKLTEISTTSHTVCCVSTRSQGCNITAPWPYSCDSLLEHQSMKIIIWINGITGCLFNFLSFSKQIYNIKLKKNRAFSISALSVSVSDLAYCLALLLLAISDRVHGVEYATVDFVWRESIACYTIAFLFLFASFLGMFSIDTMAVSRYDVIREPILSRFKDGSFSLRVHLLGLIVSCSISITFLIYYLQHEGSGQLKIGLCFLIGKSDFGFIQTLNTLLLAILQSLSSCFVSVLYGLVVNHVRESGQNVSSSKSSRDKALLKTVIVTSLTNTLCWIPSSVFFILFLVQFEISYTLLVWTIIAILSINATANPLILNTSSFKMFCRLFKELLFKDD